MFKLKIRRGIVIGVASSIALGAYLVSEDETMATSIKNIVNTNLSEISESEQSREEYDFKIIEILKRNNVVGILQEDGGVERRIYFDENRNILPLTEKQIKNNQEIINHLRNK